MGLFASVPVTGTRMAPVSGSEINKLPFLLFGEKSETSADSDAVRVMVVVAVAEFLPIARLVGAV